MHQNTTKNNQQQQQQENKNRICDKSWCKRESIVYSNGNWNCQHFYYVSLIPRFLYVSMGMEKVQSQ